MFTFAWPYVFLLLPCIWLVQKYFPGKQSNDDAMLRVPFLSHLQTLIHHTTTILPGSLKKFLALCAWSLLLIAGANPQWLGDPLPIQQDGRNVMLVVDLSPSMGIPDLQRGDHLTNRLQTVKTVEIGRAHV